MPLTSKNYTSVVDHFADYLKDTFNNSDSESKKFHIDWLNKLLDELSSDDAFGTEGQNDPRRNKLNKRFAIFTKSESGDNYAYFVKASKQPSHMEITDFLKIHANDMDEDDGTVFESEEHVMEITDFKEL